MTIFKISPVFPKLGKTIIIVTKRKAIQKGINFTTKMRQLGSSCWFRALSILWITSLVFSSLESKKVGETSEETDNISVSRSLALTHDLFTGERATTYNGKLPTISCPVGFYRPPGGTDLAPVSGVRRDGCEPCPRGRYGSTEGLTTSSCTGPCPTGRYSARLGITSITECNDCPLGRYGGSTGLSSKQCTAKCPSGKYTDTTRNVKVSDCKTCPTGYRGWQCSWAINPRFGADHDGGHNEPFGG